jgi:phosphinothricin acetyltransferase
MIRPAASGDAVAVAAIWNHMIEETLFTFNAAPKTDAEVRALITARPQAFFVAQDTGGDGLLGFVTFAQFRAGVGYAKSAEHTIVLGPQSAGRGIGRALMDRALEAAQDAGYHVMVAAITGDNPGGVAFHRALGFAQAGQMAQVGWKWGQWRDLILMQKILTGPADNPQARD